MGLLDLLGLFTQFVRRDGKHHIFPYHVLLHAVKLFLELEHDCCKVKSLQMSCERSGTSKMMDFSECVNVTNFFFFSFYLNSSYVYSCSLHI